jgi:SSS family solute:Na+ symporter
VLTDQVQFVLMYAGFALLLGFLVAQHGTLGFLRQHLPPAHLTWHGGNSPQAILVWYFIALSALVDPGFWQRACAARDPRVARNAMLWSVACWAVFDLMTTAAGLYARALLPGLREPVFAFPELARLALPPVALGVFYLGMISTVMSTIDSYGFVAAVTVGRDVVWRIVRGDEDRVPHWTRYGLWLAVGSAAVLALASPSVVALWHDLGSITTPALLLPVGTALLGRGRLGPRWTLAAMVVPFVLSLVWVLAGALPRAGATGGYPLSIEPIYAGLAASFIVYAAGWLSPGTR